MAYPYNNFSYNNAYGGNYQQVNNGNYGNMMNQQQGFQQGQQSQQNGNVGQNYTPQNYGMYNYNPMFYNPYQQAQQQMQQPQTVYHPLTYVSGVEGAKAFVVDANKKVFLLDSETNEKLFIKYADNEGRYKMETYRLVKDDGSAKQESKPQNSSENDLTKDFLTSYVTNEINALEGKFQGNFNELARKIESLGKQNVNVPINNTQNANTTKKQGV